jgi:magnesium chelatase subunit D
LKNTGYVFPFTAIVGQEDLKISLLLNAINPLIGGVLIRGHKGTSKSTAVRGLAELVPEIEVVEGCPFSCDPDDREQMCEYCLERDPDSLTSERRRMRLTEMPLNVSEDRVVGSLDLEKAISTGEKRFEPGVLAEANRGILYIDEVNLLDDHIVDVILDAAAMGRNIVEREGISFSHPSRFILVGTMNPEEGELRPQLQDRFGLCVEIEGIADASSRIEVIKRREEFDWKPEAFISHYADSQHELAERIAQAKRHLNEVHIGEEMLGKIVDIASAMEVHGHRADITITKTARTLAAYYQRTEVEEEDVRRASHLSLLHRLRTTPLRDGEKTKSSMSEVISESLKKNETEPERGTRQLMELPRSRFPDEKEQCREVIEPNRVPWPRRGEILWVATPSQDESISPVGRTFDINRLTLSPSLRQRKYLYVKNPAQSARTMTSIKTLGPQGRHIRNIGPRPGYHHIALGATLTAAAPSQLRRGRQPGRTPSRLLIEPRDFRFQLCCGPVRRLVLFVVDASGSMGAKDRMAATKGAILSLISHVYQYRERIGLITFRREEAVLNLSPTRSVELAMRRLEELPTGGTTPLPRGLELAYEVIERERLREPGISPLLIIVTDGRANISLEGGDAVQESYRIARLLRERGIQSVVINTDPYTKSAPPQQCKALLLARELGAKYYHLKDLERESVVRIVSEELGRLTKELI